MSALPRRAALLLAALAIARAVRPARAAEEAVNIDNFAFVPAVLTVPAGTTVVWRNRDDIPHTVLSSDSPPRFHSPPLDTGDSFSHVFDTPGTFRYFCSIHPHMQGSVVVT